MGNLRGGTDVTPLFRAALGMEPDIGSPRLPKPGLTDPSNPDLPPPPRPESPRLSGMAESDIASGPRHVPRVTLAMGAVVTAAVAYGLLSYEPTTSPSDLAAGDCFVVPEEIEVADVKDQSCTEPHDAEVMGTRTAITRWENVPDDALVPYFHPTSRAYQEGEREVICYIVSDSGLTAPVTG